MASIRGKSQPKGNSSERRREQNRQAQRNRRRSMKVRMEHYDQICNAMGIDPVSTDDDVPQMLSSPPPSRQRSSLSKHGQDSSSDETTGPSTPGPTPPSLAAVPDGLADSIADSELFSLDFQHFNFGPQITPDGSVAQTPCGSLSLTQDSIVSDLPLQLCASDNASIGNVPPREWNGGSTALHFAVTTRSREMVALLLTHGARVDVHDHAGDTPLHLAVTTDDCDLLEKMLQTLQRTMTSEAPQPWIDLQNDLGLTPLQVALSRGHTSAARLLLAAGADPNRPMPLEFSQ